jgi:glycerol-3-phosphate dehydrogenase (NAD(P)+)
MTNKSISVIGAGSWGTALSMLLANNGYKVNLWVYEKILCDKIKETRENNLFLPGFNLSKNIYPTNSLNEAIGTNEVILLVIPTKFVRLISNQLASLLSLNSLVINAGKGIEIKSLLTIRQILEETLPKTCKLASLSGPTFALEIAKGMPSAIVAASDSEKTALLIQSIFTCDHLKVFISDDPIGVEIGGALKNIIAITTGISDGLKAGNNARAAIITRGLVEMIRIGTTLGAKAETFSGLTGLGDMVLTCTGELSRNRQLGLRIGNGEKIHEIMKDMKTSVEGFLTVKSAYELKNKLNIQASIINETYKVLYESKPPHQALESLMNVKINSEFEGIKG